MGREVLRNLRRGKHDQNILYTKGFFFPQKLVQLYNMINFVSLKHLAGFLFLVTHSEINGFKKTSINDHLTFTL